MLVCFFAQSVDSFLKYIMKCRISFILIYIITKNGKIFNAAYTIFFALDKQKIIWQNSDINLRKV